MRNEFGYDVAYFLDHARRQSWEDRNLLQTVVGSDRYEAWRINFLQESDERVGLKLKSLLGPDYEEFEKDRKHLADLLREIQGLVHGELSPVL